MAGIYLSLEKLDYAVSLSIVISCFIFNQPYICQIPVHRKEVCVLKWCPPFFPPKNISLFLEKETS